MAIRGDRGDKNYWKISITDQKCLILSIRSVLIIAFLAQQAHRVVWVARYGGR
jgi:hypothetical protein